MYNVHSLWDLARFKLLSVLNFNLVLATVKIYVFYTFWYCIATCKFKS